MRHSQDQLVGMLDSIAEAIYCVDMTGKCTYCNASCLKILSYRSADELLGRNMHHLIHHKKRNGSPYPDHECPIYSTFEDGREVHIDDEIFWRSDGTSFAAEYWSFPLRESGEIVGAVVSFLDITSRREEETYRRRTHDELIRAKSAAEHAESLAKSANKSRREFLANISHELRTPMNAIIGMIQLSLDEPLNSTVADYLKTARSSAHSLLELVNELLDFSKMEAGKFDIHAERFDLHETVDAIAKSLSPKASEKGLELICEIEPTTPTALVGDDRRIQQVVSNLVSNAIKFTERGEVVIRVSSCDDAACDSGRTVLEVSVTDTGIGIQDKDLERIFSPFAQADMSTTRKHYGTGLGLTICQELLELMGSHLELESAIGHGSRFFFQLELQIDDGTDAAKSVPTELVKNLQVLIVDDNQTNLRILEKIFFSWSMQPITANSGAQAIRILEEQKKSDRAVSLAVIDGMMPGMDGFDLAERIANDPELGDLPAIIMHTASDMSLFSEKKKRAPVNGYVMKPVSQSELMDTVVESLDLYVQPHVQDLARKPEPALIKSLNVLLVEDLSANQKVACAILEKRGHQVTVADNGRIGLELLQNAEPEFDLVLMDVQMPVMDGLQATAAIRQLDSASLAQIPIIAMTAHAMRGDREECLAAGMDAYLAKPLDSKKFISLVETVKHQPRKFRRPNDIHARDRTTLAGDRNRKQGPLVDLESSLKRLGGDRNLLREFISIFREDAPTLAEGLKSAIAEDDASGVQKQAHALKGLVSSFGAQACVDVASKIEAAGRNQELKSLPEDFSQLQTVLAALEEELKTLSDHL